MYCTEHDMKTNREKSKRRDTDTKIRECMSLFSTEASSLKLGKEMPFIHTFFCFALQMTDIYLPLLVGATMYFAQKVSLFIRAIHNFFDVGGGGEVAMSLAEIENMSTLQFFTVGGSRDMLPQEIFIICWCSEVHSEEHTGLLEMRLIVNIIAC